MKRVTTETQIPDQNFIDAAEILVKKTKTPVDLLSFLTDAVGWVHRFEIDKEKYDECKDRHYELCSLINLLVIPWLKGGNEMINNIATGFKNIYEMADFEGYHDTLGAVVAAYGKSFETGVAPPDLQAKYLLCIATLIECSYPIYEFAINDKRKIAS